jgi:hypothetical protein
MTEFTVAKMVEFTIPKMAEFTVVKWLSETRKWLTLAPKITERRQKMAEMRGSQCTGSVGSVGSGHVEAFVSHGHTGSVPRGGTWSQSARS